MAPFAHTLRARALGGGALIAAALCAIALAQAHGQPHDAASHSTPHHTAVTIQRASATAAGQIAQPLRVIPLVHMPQPRTWQQGGGEHHHGHHGGGG